MLDKLKDGMKNHVQNGAAAEIAKEEKIRGLFKDTVTNFDDYVFGIAQVETEAKGVTNALAGMVTNSIMLDWKDYIVAVHNSKREMVVREITDDSIGEKHLFSEDFKIKKDTLIGNEIKDTLNQLFRIRAPKSGDRLKRNIFTIKNGNTKMELLVGNYVNEGTNYPYDNAILISRLKELVKIKK